MASIPQSTEELIAAGWVEVTPGDWRRPKSLSPIPGEPETIHAPVNRERQLHDEIEAWCLSQFPRVKYIHSRMDQPSTIQVGCQDFTLFLPNGRTVCIECKAKDKKLDPDQLIWKKEMEMLGHKVHVVYSMDEFLEILNPPHYQCEECGAWHIKKPDER